MRKLRIYIAGPYTKGDVALNVRNAIEVATQLKEAGHIPFIPHLCHFWHMLFPHAYDFWMDYDIAWLEVCDAVFRLPGDSSGADRETMIAMHRGMPVFMKIEELIDFANKIK